MRKLNRPEDIKEEIRIMRRVRTVLYRRIWCGKAPRTFVCPTIVWARVECGADRKYADHLLEWVQSMLQGCGPLESWQAQWSGVSGICGTNLPARIQWVEWMIEELKRDLKKARKKM